jgi:hypothetical protein
MVGYDDNADALTLGDDDVLTVGDYEISYDSTADEWQATYTPTGDVASVPKNQSGSLFPTDFADALAGKALADDGNIYSSPSTALDNASSWIFIGPGTFNDQLDISTGGMTVIGSGYNTLLDGGTTDEAVYIRSGEDITVRNLSVKTTSGGGTGLSAVGTSNSGTSGARIENVAVRESDDHGLTLGPYSHVRNVTVEAADGNGIDAGTEAAVISNCVVQSGVQANGIDTSASADNSIIAGNSVIQVTSNGIFVEGADSVIIGNRVHGVGAGGIDLRGTDQIAANNRVSDSGSGTDIETSSATNPILDDNLTGASN